MPSQRQFNEWKRRIAYRRKLERERIAKDLWDRIKNEKKTAHIRISDVDLESYADEYYDWGSTASEWMREAVDKEILNAVKKSL